jgi:hypothetical protein
MVGTEHGGRLHKADPVGDPIAYKEIGQGRDRKITEDFRQRVDLVLLPYRTDFQKREAGMHRQDHHRADQNKQRIGAMDESVHRALHIFHGDWQACSSGKSTKAVHCPTIAH